MCLSPLIVTDVINVSTMYLNSLGGENVVLLYTCNVVLQLARLVQL